MTIYYADLKAEYDGLDPKYKEAGYKIQQIMLKVARKDLDAQVVTELLYAPVYFRLLFQSGPLDAKATNSIMQTALEGLAAG